MGVRQKRFVSYQSRKPDPYKWPHVIVEVANFRDRCGCRRERLRAYDAAKKSRWVMYYETQAEPFVCCAQDRRVVTVDDPGSVFIGKVYADTTSFYRKINETNFYKAQQELMREVVWVIRPCRHMKMTVLQRRPYHYQPSAGS